MPKKTAPSKPKTPRPVKLDTLVIASKVKEVIRCGGMRSDGALVEAVSCKVHEILQAAMVRAKDNKRNTVRPTDVS